MHSLPSTIYVSIFLTFFIIILYYIFVHGKVAVFCFFFLHPISAFSYKLAPSSFLLLLLLLLPLLFCGLHFSLSVGRYLLVCWGKKLMKRLVSTLFLVFDVFFCSLCMWDLFHTWVLLIFIFFLFSCLFFLRWVNFDDLLVFNFFGLVFGIGCWVDWMILFFYCGGFSCGLWRSDWICLCMVIVFWFYFPWE